MPRKAFTATEIEAKAIVEAESWLHSARSIEQVLQRGDEGEPAAISQARQGASKLATALGKLFGEPIDADPYEGQADALLAALQSSEGTGWGLRPKDEVFGQMQRFQMQLRALLWGLEALAPQVGAPQHPDQRLFVMRAADNWLRATGNQPTAAGRFQKAIAAVSTEFSTLTAKRIASALQDWAALRGFPTPNSQ